MGIIKVYTDLPQSKKLAEILSIESADGGWYGTNNPLAANTTFWLHTKYSNKAAFPAWSLAALLNILPKNIPHKDAKHIENRKYWTYSWHLTSKCLFYKCIILLEDGGIYNDIFVEVYYQDNLIDACVDMILKLNELNLL